MDIKQRNKELKKVLANIFDKKYVSVRGATGTAYGWALINIDLPKPITCQCDEMFGVGMNREPGFCPLCKDIMQKANERAEDAIKNIDFYTFTADDGYNTEYKEYLLQIRFA